MLGAELFDDTAGGDAEDRGRARSTPRRKAAVQTAPAPGSALEPVWSNCRDGEHASCAFEVLVQAPWATAGLKPPSSDAKPVSLERCACTCHAHPRRRGVA